MLIRRTYRTGVQTVEREGGRYYLTIRNRTYASEHEVPIETARRYYRALKGEKPMRYLWGNNPRRAELKGRECMIEAMGRMGSVLIRFRDTGERVVSSWRSVG